MIGPPRKRSEIVKPLPPTEIPPPSLAAEITKTVQMARSILAYWQQREADAQQALAQAQHENRVRGECLEIAIAVLKRLEVSTTWKHVAAGALTKIEQRLAQLGPEEETG